MILHKWKQKNLVGLWVFGGRSSLYNKISKGLQNLWTSNIVKKKNSFLEPAYIQREILHGQIIFKYEDIFLRECNAVWGLI